MKPPTYRALVVDDEPLIRRLTQRALTQEGFECDLASDGIEAGIRMQGCRYDVVVTDLRMPKKHGYALSTEMLAMSARPLIIVLTGVIEPALAKDLLGKGVDDIVFKPVDYIAFAAKVKALTERSSPSRHLEQRPAERSQATATGSAGRPSPSAQTSAAQSASTVTASTASAAGPAADQPQPSAVAADAAALADAAVAADVTDGAVVADPKPVDPADFAERIKRLSDFLPSPPAALKVYFMANSDDFDAGDFADAIKEDLILAEVIVQLANCRLFKRSGAAIETIDRAMVQLGRIRTGQLALAAGAVSAFRDQSPAWMDTDRLWHHSIATGLTVERLIANGEHRKQEDGLLLCSMVQSLGRGILAAMFPDHYEQALAAAKAQSKSLIAQEQQLYPESPAQVLHRTLVHWKVSRDLCEPLLHVDRTFAEVSELDEPLRTRVELVKLASTLASLTSGTWQCWDQVDVPSQETLSRLKPGSIEEVIREVGISSQSFFETSETPSVETPRRPLAYRSLQQDGFDFAQGILQQIYDVQPPRSSHDDTIPKVVNCLGVATGDLADSKRPLPTEAILCHTQQATGFGQDANVLAFPTSFGMLQQAFTPTIS